MWDGQLFAKVQPYQVTPEEMHAEGKRLRWTSSAGPSGRRPSYVRQMLRAKIGRDVAVALAKRSNAILAATVPLRMGPRLAQARSYTPWKNEEKGTVRPIACGEVEQRLAGRCVLKKHAPDMRPTFEDMSQQGNRLNFTISERGT